MNKAQLALLSDELVNALIETGIVPDRCVRVIIDVKLNEIAKVYYETYASRKLLEIDWRSLKGAFEIKGPNNENAH